MKSREEFHKNCRTLSGYAYNCKKCKNVKSTRIVLTREQTLANKRRMENTRYSENKEIIKARVKSWKQDNPHKLAFYNASRKRAVKRATPIWANKLYMELFYLMAQEAETEFGIKFHVDHIIPINHKLVCGLHNEHNMQVLDESENCSKSNSWCIYKQA